MLVVFAVENILCVFSYSVSLQCTLFFGVTFLMTTQEFFLHSWHFFKRHCAIIVESVAQGIAVESFKKK